MWLLTMAMVVILACLIGYAWIGGGREPLRTIIVPVRPATAA